MIFNSVEFALFLPVFLLIYYAVLRNELRREILLLVASYIFYMMSYWKYAWVLAFSTVLDYSLGLAIEATQDQVKRKRWLILSIFSNLSILAFFKYFNFFAAETEALLGLLGIKTAPIFLDVVLPAGISFYTFQSMSYTIDVYRREIKAEKSLLRYAVFVSLFPQLVAGPIVRGRDFLPQLSVHPKISMGDLRLGWSLIFLGIAKKVLIADQLAYLGVDHIFDNPTSFSSFDLLFALYGYAFQIYCDFSGYSDTAIGLAIIMGFRFPPNFNRPYLSQNPSEFWQRWHISLSSWLRDYLYISMGGNRGGKTKTARNLMLTMLIGGLWHGAAMNFVLWGGFHGVILVLTRNLKSEVTFNWKYVRNVFLMFHVTLVGWLLFRIGSLNVGIDYLEGLASMTGGTILSWQYFAVLFVAALLHFVPVHMGRSHYIEKSATAPVVLSSLFFAVSIAVLLGFSIYNKAFIYFQF